jgi:hypothetical protein
VHVCTLVVHQDDWLECFINYPAVDEEHYRRTSSKRRRRTVTKPCKQTKFRPILDEQRSKYDHLLVHPRSGPATLQNVHPRCSSIYNNIVRLYYLALRFTCIIHIYKHTLKTWCVQISWTRTRPSCSRMECGRSSLRPGKKLLSTLSVYGLSNSMVKNSNFML